MEIWESLNKVLRGCEIKSLLKVFKYSWDPLMLHSLQWKRTPSIQNKQTKYDSSRSHHTETRRNLKILVMASQNIPPRGGQGYHEQHGTLNLQETAPVIAHIDVQQFCIQFIMNLWCRNDIDVSYSNYQLRSVVYLCRNECSICVNGWRGHETERHTTHWHCLIYHYPTTQIV